MVEEQIKNYTYFVVELISIYTKIYQQNEVWIENILSIYCD